MKKRIVFLIGGLNFGGMERVVFIAKDLLQKDYDVKIVTQYQSSADYKSQNEYYNLDVPPSKNKLFPFLKRLVRCVKMKKELTPDVVYSFGMYANYLNILSNFFYHKKCKTIAGIRSYDWMTDGFFSKKIDKWIMNRFDTVNSVSKLIATDAQKIWNIPKDKNTVIYNPYDIEYINKVANESIDDYTFDKEKFYIITMGRLADQKGYNNLIRTMSIVSKKIPNIELLILGNGTKKAELEKMIKIYHLNNVKLLGGKKNPYKYVKKCNLYVLSSITEGFPNAMAEAMCIGTPIVSVNCKSGPSEIFLDKPQFDLKEKEYLVTKYGIITQPMEQNHIYEKTEISFAEKSLANAICYAYNHQEQMKQLAENAKKHMKQFSYEAFYEKLKQIID